MRRLRDNEEGFHSINITPFTDVILVLLLVFLVAGPSLLAGSVALNLPRVSEAAEPPATPLTVSADAQRRVYLDAAEVPFDSLTTLLAARLGTAGDSTNVDGPPVTVRADSSLSFGFTVRLLDAIRKAGGKVVLDVQTGG